MKVVSASCVEIGSAALREQSRRERIRRLEATRSRSSAIAARVRRRSARRAAKAQADADAENYAVWAFHTAARRKRAVILANASRNGLGASHAAAGVVNDQMRAVTGTLHAERVERNAAALKRYERAIAKERVRRESAKRPSARRVAARALFADTDRTNTSR